jgi:hypothetical protein
MYASLTCIKFSNKLGADRRRSSVDDELPKNFVDPVSIPCSPSLVLCRNHHHPLFASPWWSEKGNSILMSSRFGSPPLKQRLLVLHPSDQTRGLTLHNEESSPKQKIHTPTAAMKRQVLAIQHSAKDQHALQNPSNVDLNLTLIYLGEVGPHLPDRRGRQGEEEEESSLIGETLNPKGLGSEWPSLLLERSK